MIVHHARGLHHGVADGWSNEAKSALLQILADANRVAQGKTSANDVITMTVVYPDSTVVTLTNGRITDSMFGKSIAGSGRLKTKAYAFSFANKIGV